MKSIKRFVFVVLLCPVLFTGCASLEHQFDRALFGSDENIRIAKEEIKERQKDIAFQDSLDLEKKLYRYISEARMKGYLEPYPRNDEMMAYARARAGEIAELYGPVRPNGQPFTTLYNELPGRKTYGKITREIRIKNILDPKLIMELWLQDPATRAVILHRDPIEYAVGLHMKGKTPYWVFVISEMMEY